MSQRGHDRERAVRRLKEKEGWWVARAAGSLGDADLICLRGGIRGSWWRPQLIEIKSTKQGPYEHFGPQDRRELLAAAQRAGADALLAYWPPRGELVYISPEDWP